MYYVIYAVISIILFLYIPRTILFSNSIHKYFLDFVPRNQNKISILNSILL